MTILKAVIDYKYIFAAGKEKREMYPKVEFTYDDATELYELRICVGDDCGFIGHFSLEIIKNSIKPGMWLQLGVVDTAARWSE